jgi:hypothetical protein
MSQAGMRQNAREPYRSVAPEIRRHEFRPGVPRLHSDTYDPAKITLLDCGCVEVVAVDRTGEQQLRVIRTPINVKMALYDALGF